MNTRLLHVWDRLQSSYWFVPTVMSVGAFGLALATLRFDRSVDPHADEVNRLVYLGGSDGARSLLSTVAASVITVAGVVFSITISTLTQASSQFGPRLLRNFMRDTGNQVVLGTFTATFLYCLLVLRAIHGPDEGNYAEFVPHFSVTVAVVLSLCSMAVLIYFIHHVSASLQAPLVAAHVARDLDEAIDRMFPQDLGVGGSPTGVDPDWTPDNEAPPAPPSLAGEPAVVCARGAGYLQAIDEDGVLACADGRAGGRAARAAPGAARAVLRLLRRPGDFVTSGEPLVEVWPKEAAADEAFAERVRDSFLLGSSRTPEQDVEFAIDQLVEVAVRALSPGINDPFTAIHCIDWLGQALGRLGRKRLPSPYRYDARGRLCVIARVSDADGLVDAAFDQIRQYGRTSVSVTVRLLETIAVVAQTVDAPEWRRNLLRHADMIRAQARREFTEAHDLRSIENRYATATRALRGEPGTGPVCATGEGE